MNVVNVGVVGPSDLNSLLGPSVRPISNFNCPPELRLYFESKSD